MFFKQRSRNVAQLVGAVLIGSVVEAHAPNEIHQNRFRLRCECGSEFYALTKLIHNRRRHRARLVCNDCTAEEKQAPVVRLPAKRCAHGFIGGENCQECHPEIRCCTYCWMPGHDEPACRFSPKGKRMRQAARERRRYGLRKVESARCDISCPTQVSASGRGES